MKIINLVIKYSLRPTLCRFKVHPAEELVYSEGVRRAPVCAEAMAAAQAQKWEKGPVTEGMAAGSVTGAPGESIRLKVRLKASLKRGVVDHRNARITFDSPYLHQKCQPKF